jgi:hypothetical protein
MPKGTRSGTHTPRPVSLTRFADALRTSIPARQLLRLHSLTLTGDRATLGLKPPPFTFPNQTRYLLTILAGWVMSSTLNPPLLSVCTMVPLLASPRCPPRCAPPSLQLTHHPEMWKSPPPPNPVGPDSPEAETPPQPFAASPAFVRPAHARPLGRRAEDLDSCAPPPSGQQPTLVRPPHSV